MPVASGEYEVSFRRLIWIGPAAVAVSALAVYIVQRTTIAVFQPLPTAFGLVNTNEPVVLTTVFVTVAVLVFAVVSHEAMDPIRTYRRIALTVLILSFLPDILLASTSAPGSNLWPLAIVFMIMHAVAWLATVETLVRLTSVRRSAALTAPSDT